MDCSLNLEMRSAHPDAQLFPHATGLAGRLVEAHKAEQPLKFYAGWFCPFVQRSWVVLEELHIPYQYIEINPYHKEKSFLKLNPRGLVPTLGCSQSDGSTKPLYESNIISEYLDTVYAAKSPGGKSLFPSSPYEKVRSKIWIDFVTSRILPAFHRFLQHTSKSPYSLESAREELLGHLKTWIKEADKTGPLFHGAELSMVDITLAPWAVRLWVFDHFKDGGLGLPEKGEGGENEEVWERWRRWSKAISERGEHRRDIE